MKFNTNALTKNLLVVLITLALLISTGIAQPSTPANSEDPLSVKYIGMDGDFLLFEVTLIAGNMKDPLFAIEDETEGEIYSKSVAANARTIHFRIEKTTDQSLSFYLVSGKKLYTRSFSENDINQGIAFKPQFHKAGRSNITKL
jgi:hypothetical protein